MEPAAEGVNTNMVKFNVGGKLFEVLYQPTLALHPNSLLHQLAEDSKDGEAIFIEANADLFQYMLDYHRHRKIHIPFTVSKQAILQEAKLLGLPVTEENIVQESPPLRELGSCTEVALRLSGEDNEKLLRESKISTLGALVIKCALQKVGRSAQISVNSREIVQMEQWYNKCTSCGNLQNTSGAVMAYLATGFQEADLCKFLKPWSSKNGYRVSVTLPTDTNGQPMTISDGCGVVPNFTVTFG